MNCNSGIPDTVFLTNSNSDDNADSNMRKEGMKTGMLLGKKIPLHYQSNHCISFICLMFSWLQKTTTATTTTTTRRVPKKSDTKTWCVWWLEVTVRLLAQACAPSPSSVPIIPLFLSGMHPEGFFVVVPSVYNTVPAVLNPQLC